MKKRTAIGAAAAAVLVLVPGCHIQDTYGLGYGVVQEKIRNVEECGPGKPLPWPECIEYVLVIQGVANHGNVVRGRQPVHQSVWESCAVGDNWRETSDDGMNSFCRDE